MHHDCRSPVWKWPLLGRHPFLARLVSSLWTKQILSNKWTCPRFIKTKLHVYIIANIVTKQENRFYKAQTDLRLQFCLGILSLAFCNFLWLFRENESGKTQLSVREKMCLYLQENELSLRSSQIPSPCLELVQMSACQASSQIFTDSRRTEYYIAITKIMT